MRNIAELPTGNKRAENETRTRDPNLGKVVLYQLSYFRVIYRLAVAFSLKRGAKVRIVFIPQNVLHRFFEFPCKNVLV